MSKPPLRKQHPKTETTLGSIMRFFLDETVVVELKNGQRYTGTMESADATMSVVLSEAVRCKQPALEFPMMQIRGSQIRYIEFVENDFDFQRTIKEGLAREKSAAQKYKRGIRKS